MSTQPGLQKGDQAMVPHGFGKGTLADCDQGADSLDSRAVGVEGRGLQVQVLSAEPPWVLPLVVPWAAPYGVCLAVLFPWPG